MLSIRELVRQGKTSAEIAEYIADATRSEQQQAVQAELKASRKATHIARKARVGNSCKVCGCLITEYATHCHTHSRADIPKATKSTDKPVKCVTRTFYGKSNDLMDHSYYQGGSVSPR